MTTQPIALDDPLLVGKLVIRQLPGDPAPMLMVVAHCPWCRLQHTHRWDDASARTGIVQRVRAKCDKGPFKGQTIAVGLDPDRASESWQVAEDFRRGRTATRHAKQVA